MAIIRFTFFVVDPMNNPKGFKFVMPQSRVIIAIICATFMHLYAPSTPVREIQIKIGHFTQKFSIFTDLA